LATTREGLGRAAAEALEGAVPEARVARVGAAKAGVAKVATEKGVTEKVAAESAGADKGLAEVLGPGALVVTSVPQYSCSLLSNRVMVTT
jgi:hypothetical protein